MSFSPYFRGGCIVWLYIDIHVSQVLAAACCFKEMLTASCIVYVVVRIGTADCRKRDTGFYKLTRAEGAYRNVTSHIMLLKMRGKKTKERGGRERELITVNCRSGGKQGKWSMMQKKGQVISGMRWGGDHGV